MYSHVDKYCRAKLNQNDNEESGMTVVHNLHAVLGCAKRKWVLGLICLREDGHYYLEDGTYTVKISFQQLEYVEPDAFFTENSVILAEGHYDNDMFKLHQVYHPPLHANKSLKYKLNEQDYFGSYLKMSEQIESIFNNQNQKAISSKQPSELDNLDPCIVVVSQVELDQAKHLSAIKTMLIGLESMRPEVIVLAGNFISAENNEMQTFDKFKSYFDQIL